VVIDDVNRAVDFALPCAFVEIVASLPCRFERSRRAVALPAGPQRSASSSRYRRPDATGNLFEFEERSL
jgi:hypothetical protein